LRGAPDEGRRVVRSARIRNAAGDAVVDLGMPLGNGRAVSKAGVANEKSQIVGFSILEGESMDEIAALLKDHPHLHLPGSTIKVLEELPLPGA